MIDHSEKAAELFLRGYNCSQSVAAAFCDVTGADENEILKLSSPFGGGFGRSREVCGTISGVCTVLGQLYGYTDPSDAKGKSEVYALVRSFIDDFRKIHGSIICRELLGGTAKIGGEPSERTEEFYRTRPCLCLVISAAELLDKMIAEIDANP